MRTRKALTVATMFVFLLFGGVLIVSTTDLLNGSQRKTTVHKSPDKPIIIFNQTNPTFWKTSTWQSFRLSYPNEFVLTDGGFDKDFFFLTHSQITENAKTRVRIFGISEDWQGASWNKIFRDIKIGYQQGYARFSLPDT